MSGSQRSRTFEIDRTLSLLTASLEEAHFGPLRKTQLEALAGFLGELGGFHHLLRLVSELNPEDIALHLLESLSVGSKLRPGAQTLDIGPGGGFPGIPMGILRADVRIVLLERRQRVAAYLDHVVQALGLKHVRVSCLEFEKALATGSLACIQEITAKAVWSWQEYLRKVLPLLQENARAWVFGTPSLTKESVGEFLQGAYEGDMLVSSFDIRLAGGSPERRIFSVSLGSFQT